MGTGWRRLRGACPHFGPGSWSVACAPGSVLGESAKPINPVFTVPVMTLPDCPVTDVPGSERGHTRMRLTRSSWPPGGNRTYVDNEGCALGCLEMPLEGSRPTEPRVMTEFGGKIVRLINKRVCIPGKAQKDAWLWTFAECFQNQTGFVAQRTASFLDFIRINQENARETLRLIHETCFRLDSQPPSILLPPFWL